jgi:hypothetical protein
MERPGKDVVRRRLASRQPIGDHPDEDPPPVVAILWLNEQSATREGANKRRCWILALTAVASAAAGFVGALPALRSWSWFTRIFRR